MNSLANPSCNSPTICTTFTSSRTTRYHHAPSPPSLFIADKSERRTRIYIHGSSISSSLVTNIRKRRCEFYDLHDQLVPYADAWSWQKAIVKEKKQLIANNEDFSDTLIILQHPPVYTLGTGSSENHLRFGMNDAPFDVCRTDRGGAVRYHGPGQLVMYPILNLRYHGKDLNLYLRALEDVVIRALSSTFFINASTIKGLTGVWVGEQKLAAIGVKVAPQWVAYHGLSLNITTDLSPFNHIVPCGIRDRRVGTLKGLQSNPVVPIGCEADISHHQNYDHKLIDIACKSLVKEFSEIFQVELCLRQQNPLLAASG